MIRHSFEFLKFGYYRISKIAEFESVSTQGVLKLTAQGLYHSRTAQGSVQEHTGDIEATGQRQGHTQDQGMEYGWGKQTEFG